MWMRWDPHTNKCIQSCERWNIHTNTHRPVNDGTHAQTNAYRAVSNGTLTQSCDPWDLHTNAQTSTHRAVSDGTLTHTSVCNEAPVAAAQCRACPACFCKVWSRRCLPARPACATCPGMELSTGVLKVQCHRCFADLAVQCRCPCCWNSAGLKPPTAVSFLLSCIF